MGLKIVVIEDDSGASDLAKAILENAGYEIEVVEDGERGVKRVQETRPALALVDLMLPSIHGYEVIERLRADKSLDNLRILVCSSKPFTQDIDGALDAGADAYITKPYKMEDLVAQVKKLLETGKADNPVGLPDRPSTSES